MLTYKSGIMYLYYKKKVRFKFSSKTDYRKLELINKTVTNKLGSKFKTKTKAKFYLTT